MANKVFLSKGINFLNPDEPPRYRLYVDLGAGVNLIGDRHRRGSDFPHTFRPEGWIDAGSSSDFTEMAVALDDMQKYFDKFFGDRLKKDSVKKLNLVTDSKSRSSGVKRASNPLKRNI